MVGSTFGVAVMGALVTTIGASQIDSSLPHLPAAARQQIVDALGSGAAIGGHAPAQIVTAANAAFVSALGTGLLVGALVTLTGAVVAWTLIQRRVATPATVPAQDAPKEAAESDDTADHGESDDTADHEISLV